MSSHLRFFSYAAIFVVLASTSSANAEFGGEACKEVPEPSSIQEMIEQSDFVALYWVRDRLNIKEDPALKKALDKMSPIDRLIAAPPNHRWQYRLSHSYTLRGRPPDELVIEGAGTVLDVPGEFFFMQKRHEALVNTNDLWNGSSVHETDAKGNCGFRQDFVLGYEYLIFGGVTSPAAAEPILDGGYDPFYAEVLKIINEKFKEPGKVLPVPGQN